MHLRFIDNFGTKMNFSRFDIWLVIFSIILTLVDLIFKITSASTGLEIVLMLCIFALFLIWASILTFNLSILAIDYAFDEETPSQKKFRSRRLYRTMILVGTVFVLLFGTLSLVSVYNGILGFVVSVNLLSLRGAFLFLSPEENPYFIIKTHYTN